MIQAGLNTWNLHQNLEKPYETHFCFAGRDAADDRGYRIGGDWLQFGGRRYVARLGVADCARFGDHDSPKHDAAQRAGFFRKYCGADRFARADGGNTIVDFNRGRRLVQAAATAPKLERVFRIVFCDRPA
jgi:hypothetical protein